jgi:hypothetical protein
MTLLCLHLFCADPKRLLTLARHSARTQPADAQSPDERVRRPPRERDGLASALTHALTHASALAHSQRVVGLVRLVLVAQLGRVAAPHQRERQRQRNNPGERGICAEDERPAVHHNSCR